MILPEIFCKNLKWNWGTTHLPMDTKRKLKVHKCYVRSIYVLCPGGFWFIQSFMWLWFDLVGWCLLLLDYHCTNYQKICFPPDNLLKARYYLASPFLRGGVNFNNFLRRGEIWKIKKGGGTMVQGEVFLKGGGGWRFCYLIVSRFIIFTFRNYFTLCKTVMHLKKYYFFLPP